MNELFKNTVILTRRYTRYGGDSESILALAEEVSTGYLLLFCNCETSGALGSYKMLTITSSEEYKRWLLDNSMDLMQLLHSEYSHDWYNDRNLPDGRKNEFNALLDKF